MDLSPRAHRALAALDKLARDADPRWREANYLAAQLRAGRDVITAADALLGYSTAGQGAISWDGNGATFMEARGL